MPQQWKRLGRHLEPVGRVGGPQWGAKVERPQQGQLGITPGCHRETHVASTTASQSTNSNLPQWKGMGTGMGSLSL